MMFGTLRYLGKQDRVQSVTQPSEFAVVMTKQIMRPDGLGPVTAIVRDQFADVLKGAQILSKMFRLRQSAKNEHPIG